MFSWFKQKLFSKRSSIENPNIPLNTPFFGQPTAAGVNVDEFSALHMPAFWACVRRISSDFASLRPQVFEHLPEGGKRPATHHRAYDLIYHSPDGERPAFSFWQAAVSHVLTWGNAFIEIKRDNAAEPVALQLLPPSKVQPDYVNDIAAWKMYGIRRKKIVYHWLGEDSRTIQPFNMIAPHGLSYDGLVGYSVVAMARDNIGLGLASALSMSAWYGNGNNPGGALKVPQNLTEQAKKNLREQLNMVHGGPLNQGRMMLLPPGLEWQPLTLPPPDEAFLKSRTFEVQEICRFFGMSPPLIGDLSNGTYSNVEQGILDYQNLVLRNLSDQILSEVNLKLFTDYERQRYSVEGDWMQLLKADAAGRSAYYSAGRQWGWLSVNRICHMEHQPGIGAAGDLFLIPSNMIDANQYIKNPDAFLPQQPSPPAGQQPPAGSPSSNPPTPPAAKEQMSNEQQAAVRSVLADMLGRMVRRECQALKRAAKKPKEFLDWIDEYYGEHERFMAAAITPAVWAYQLAVSNRSSGVSEQIAIDHCKRSRKLLRELSDVTTRDQLPAALDDLCERWQAKRAEESIDWQFRGTKDDSGHEHDKDGKFTGNGSGGGQAGSATPKHQAAGSAAHEKLKAGFSKTLSAVSQVKPEMAKKYEGDIHHVVDRMSPEAVKRVSANVSKVKWHSSTKEVTAHVGKLMKERGKDFNAEEHNVAGCYDNREKNLVLDGGYGEESKHHKANSGKQIYAHELGHALDCPAGGDPKTDRISSTREWKKAHDEELGGGQLSAYAAKGGPVESFAEFARLAILEPDRAKKEFPKSWGVWKSHGLD